MIVYYSTKLPVKNGLGSKLYCPFTKMVWGKLWMSKSPRYSLVPIPALMFKMQFYVSLVVELVMIMTATLAFQLMSGNPSTIAFVELKKRFGNGSTIDKVNCFPNRLQGFHQCRPASHPIFYNECVPASQKIVHWVSFFNGWFFVEFEITFIEDSLDELEDIWGS